MNLPFSVYDFFGYLSCGFILLATVEYAFDGRWFLQESIPPAYLTFFIVLAYILGHVIANISSYLLEHCFLRGVLNSPEDILFEDADRKGVWPFLFPIHHQRFPEETRHRILQKAKEAGIHKTGRGLFFHCHPIVIAQEHILTRLNTFLNLYGFCRNTTMAALLSIPLLIAGMIYSFSWSKFWWMLTAIVVAIGMFYRYLKFFRHYTIEVFRTYAEMKPEHS